MELRAEAPKEISYCLYARKSSESDERQIMSIDSQIDEMKILAKRDSLKVKEIKIESHSAKESGARPVFMELITGIRSGKFNGILTWAPDRLSRNAGDLGTLVDLMDQKKLQRIQTYSQSFTNSPNEKFLLMILCSQAKLENDNKGVNVERGLRNKCTLGWKPSLAPVGYLNQKGDGRVDELIVIDSERASFVKQIFERVGNQGQSGRTVEHWLNRIGFETRLGKKLALSKIYTTLKNPFYYGEFEFPAGSGIWYKGRHKPLVAKELFDKVQEQLIVAPKTWSKNVFPYKSLIKCGSCGSSVTAEEKMRKLKGGGVTRHVYYRCRRYLDYECQEPYITEEELIKQIMANIDHIDINLSGVSRKIEEEINKYHLLKSQVLKQEYLDGNLIGEDLPKNKSDIKEMTKNYLTHTLKVGSPEERIETIGLIKTRFILKNRVLLIDS
jgi:DNA invertase Pin-like site-specific DNA recombinase